jgi:hypothetical protein
MGGTTTEGDSVMVDLIVKPRGKGNWGTSKIRASAIGFNVGETIRVGYRLYRIIDIKPVEKS